MDGNVIQKIFEYMWQYIIHIPERLNLVLSCISVAKPTKYF